MFAPSKEYLYASYTYCLQNEKSCLFCSQLSQEKSQPFVQKRLGVASKRTNEQLNSFV